MAKKKRKKKSRHEAEAAEVPIVAVENATGISAAALATFARDLSAFGSRSEKATRSGV
jgi:hypothetical protein